MASGYIVAVAVTTFRAFSHGSTWAAAQARPQRSELVAFDDRLRVGAADDHTDHAADELVALGLPALLRKLRMLNQARTLADLRLPPANRLEALKGDRRGQYSIRINRQWRICFRWRDGAVQDVEIVNYHD